MHKKELDITVTNLCVQWKKTNAPNRNFGDDPDQIYSHRFQAEQQKPLIVVWPRNILLMDTSKTEPWKTIPL